jgi:uncharacterized C2H2 Zn-finger protein
VDSEIRLRHSSLSTINYQLSTKIKEFETMTFFACCGKCGDFFYNDGEYLLHVKKCDGIRRKRELKKDDDKPPKGGKGKNKNDTEVSGSLPEQDSGSEQTKPEQNSGSPEQTDKTPETKQLPTSKSPPPKSFRPPIS